MAKTEKVKKPFYKKWWVWLIAIIFIIALNTDEETAEEPKEADVKAEETVAKEDKPEEPAEEKVEKKEAPKEEVKKKEKPKEEKPKEPEMTLSQQNAVRAAKDYIDYSAFSKKGLIEQLEFEGYSTEDATFAVGKIDVDWKEQAVQAGKDYLDFTSFSRQGLIDQLKFDGHTEADAIYAVDQIGL